MSAPAFSRRHLLAASALLTASCGPRKTSRYPGYLMVANAGSRTVAAIDLAQFRVERAIPIPFAPVQILRGSSPQHALILGESGTSVAEIGLSTLAIERRTQLGGRFLDGRLSPDNSTLWLISTEPNRLTALRLADFKVSAQFHLPALGASLAIETNRAAVSFPQQHEIGLVTLATGKLARIPLPAAPHILQFRPDGKVLLTGNPDDRSVTAIDCLAARPMVTLPLPIAPRNFCLNADGGQMFISGDGMDAISILLPYQTEIDQTILAGHAPGAMATTGLLTSPEILFIANPQSGDVTILNIDNRKVQARIEVGVRPTAILLTPDDAYALIINTGSGDVAVLKVVALLQANLASRRGRVAPLFTLMAVGENPIGGIICPRNL